MRRSGRLAAVLPIVRRLGIVSSPTNWHTPVFGPVAEDDGTRAELAEALFSRRCRSVALSWLSDGEAGLDTCRRVATQSGRWVHTRPIGRSPYVSVEGDFADYERRLTSKRRSNLRRLERRLEDEGHVSIDVSDRPAGLTQLLDEGLRVEASSWKGASGTAINSRADTDRFYRAIAHWAAQRGTLRLAFLRLDGRALAFDFALEEDGVHYLVKTGYESSYRSYAPGVLLRRAMLARAFANGLRRYEFLGVEAEWKREWTDTYHELIALEAFATSTPGVAHAVTVRLGPPLAARAKAVLRR